MVAFAPRAHAANISYTFDSSTQGFLNSTSGGTLSWVSTGGNPGGYVQDTWSCDCGGGSVGLAISTPNLHLSASDYGDLLQFDISVWYTAAPINGGNTPPTLGNELVEFDGISDNLQHTLSLSLSQGSSPVWSHVSLPVQPPGWTIAGGSQNASQMQSFLAANPPLTITVRPSFLDTTDYEFGIALDNFSLGPVPEPALALPVVVILAACVLASQTKRT